jgi:predicted acylesterase/phospholipase RssA
MAYTCKILAIDGGGIRGVIPAYILQQLEAQLSKQCFELFDVIAGTSTGGIIALGLTSPVYQAAPGDPLAPYPASEILNFYMTDESQLFVKQSSGDGTEAKYYAVDTNTSPPTGIEPWLQSKFTTALTLSQAQQNLGNLGKSVPRQVLTTCYTIGGAQEIDIGPYLFNWNDAAQGEADDYCVWEAARATSAAPTYFPIASVGAGTSNGSNAQNRLAVDGGVAANNPALYGLAQAARLGLFNSLDDVLIVSLGTGLYNVGLQTQGDLNWGMADWTVGFDANGFTTSPLLSVLTMANVLAPCEQLSAIMPQANYFRLEPDITYWESSMDGTDAPTLLTVAQDYIASGQGQTLFNDVVAAVQSS